MKVAEGPLNAYAAVAGKERLETSSLSYTFLSRRPRSPGARCAL